MSAGAIFQMVNNDGKIDKILCASDILSDRINKLRCAKRKMGLADDLPTLAEIEQTHILYVNAHFKPHVTITHEYLKQQPQNGVPAFDQEVQFQIPLFGDFFHDMVLYTKLEAVSASTGAAGSIPAFPDYIGGTGQATTATSSVSGAAGTSKYTQYTYKYVDAAGNTIDRTTATLANYVRYCDYPGCRLINKMKFDVNNNPLDEYDADVMMMYQKFRLTPNKRAGWMKLIGQEVSRESVSHLVSVSGASLFPAGATGLLDINGASTISMSNASSSVREVKSIVSGYQTPKVSQPELELWIPLLFWFSRDLRLAVPSVAIPYGQRYITAKFERQDKIVYTAPGNLFLQLTVEEFDNSAGTAAGTAVTGYRRYVTKRPVLVSGSTVNTSQKILNATLYINNIFINPEVHDIYIKKIAFTLIRLHRPQNQIMNQASAEILLNNLKWPIETLYFGFRPTVNESATNPNQPRDWYKFSTVTDQDHYTVSRSSMVTPIANADPTALTPTTLSANIAESRFAERSVYPEHGRTISRAGIKSQGVVLYQEMPTSFFNSYIPFQYGGHNIVTPSDDDTFMLTFTMYPGSYQPAGHFNVSRARETYLVYSSDWISQTNTARLIVIAIAINFLLVSDGTALVRYTT